MLAWDHPGLPVLSILAGHLRHFHDAILTEWRRYVAAELCGREGFGEDHTWTFVLFCNSLPLPIFGIKMRGCSEAFCRVGSGTVVSSGRPGQKMLLADFAGVLYGDATFSGTAPFLL